MEHLLTRELAECVILSVSEERHTEGFTCMLCPVVTCPEEARKRPRRDGHHVFALIRDYLQSPATLVASDTEGWSLNTKSSLLHDGVNCR